MIYIFLASLYYLLSLNIICLDNESVVDEFQWVPFTLDTNGHINPLNAQLNPICHLLALLGPHHIFHVSRIRVNTKIIIKNP
jgi:hypothetical protein